MYLRDFYTKKLTDYKQTNNVDSYSKLLSILLLNEINRFNNPRCSSQAFYTRYKNVINEKINKIEQDFNITDEDYLKYFNSIGVEVRDINKAKIKYIYEESIIVLQWAMIFCNDSTPEDAFEFCYDEEVKNMNLRRFRYEDY